MCDGRRFKRAFAALAVAAAVLSQTCQPVLANGHGDEPPPAAKTPAKPEPPPLPPKPTEYPRGITQKPIRKPGTPAPAAPGAHDPAPAHGPAPAPAHGPAPATGHDTPPPAGHEPAPAGHEPPPAGHDPAPAPGHEAAKTPPPAHGEQQPMPPPIEGAKAEEKPEAKDPHAPQPADAHANPAPAAEKPAPGAKTDDRRAKLAAWVPPKRYHFIEDTFTGLAIGGNDPVSFYVDGEPREGSADFQLDWGGTTWHFVNEGNQAAFKQHPEVYAPLFGGRCAYAMSQGIAAEGAPQFYVIYHDRLLLFANAGNRAAFMTNPDILLEEAERVWPSVVRNEP